MMAAVGGLVVRQRCRAALGKAASIAERGFQWTRSMAPAHGSFGCARASFGSRGASADASRAREVLGWSPPYSMHDGVRAMMDAEMAGVERLLKWV